MRGPGIDCVLTVAGSDSGGGAGIQADARVIGALGLHPITVVTAVTAQNTRGIQSWRPVPSTLVAEQLASVLGDFRIRAAKTGLLPGAAAVSAVAAALAQHPSVPLVVDPVLASTSGTRFLGESGIRALCSRLLPRAALLTPNWREAAVLACRPVRTYPEAEDAARFLGSEYGCAVLVKGGHAGGRRSRDVLAAGTGAIHWFDGPRIRTRHTHGTGCVLSSAIATGLAQGMELTEAVARARDFLRRALEQGAGVPWGPGTGPAYFTASAYGFIR